MVGSKLLLDLPVSGEVIHVVSTRCFVYETPVTSEQAHRGLGEPWVLACFVAVQLVWPGEGGRMRVALPCTASSL